MHPRHGATVDIPVSIFNLSFFLLSSFFFFFINLLANVMYGLYHCEYMVIPCTLVSFRDVISSIILLTRNDESFSQMKVVFYPCTYREVKETSIVRRR